MIQRKISRAFNATEQTDFQGCFISCQWFGCALGGSGLHESILARCVVRELRVHDLAGADLHTGAQVCVHLVSREHLHVR